MRIQIKEVIENFRELLSLKESDVENTIKNFDKINEIIPFIVIKNKERQFQILLSIINKKFEYNRLGIKYFIDELAKERVYFNTFERDQIQDAFNFNDINKLTTLMTHRDLPKDRYLKLFKPISQEIVMQNIKKELNTSKRNDILASLFANFVFKLSREAGIKKIFHKDNEIKLKKSLKFSDNYLNYVHQFLTEKINKSQKLIYFKIDKALFDDCNNDYNTLLNEVLGFLKKSFSLLSNHCFLFVKIENIIHNKTNIKWDLYSKICIFAEKFYKTKELKNYFRHKKISKDTQEYIKYDCNLSDLEFDVADIGFQFRDCYILQKDSDFVQSSLIRNVKNINEILLSFQKNFPDETPIPCPSCYSLNIQTNSYPQIGIRSWECENPLCPDRSKYNRGKRFSYSSLRLQKDKNNQNKIDNKLISKWMLDVVNIKSDDEIIEMILKFFSFAGDNVLFINDKPQKNKLYDRNITSFRIKEIIDGKEDFTTFFDSNFFKRFIVKNNKTQKIQPKNLTDNEKIKLFEGDSLAILKLFEENFFDGAVTSPPYYNTKEYSQWNNIYCYLYDMYNIILESYNILKEGSLFVYNIFDTYGNENNIVLSDMGQKRIILGAYTIYLFQKAGFQLLDNIIWDKGYVHGTRHTNGGNKLPYNQFPLNSWEHNFIFYKPSKVNFNTDKKIINVKRFSPVRKFFKKGVNSYGHSAPYPEQIPEILFELIDDKNKVIFDPFSGSMTTGIAAIKRGLKSVNIEKNKEYCNLSLKRLEKYLKYGLVTDSKSLSKTKSNSNNSPQIIYNQI